MWTSNDMTLSAFATAQQFALDCYPDRRLVYAWNHQPRSRTWEFAILGINGVFTLVKSRDNTMWVCDRSPFVEPAR